MVSVIHNFHSANMLFFILCIPFALSEIIRDDVDFCVNKKCNETHSTCGIENGKPNCVNYNSPGNTVIFVKKKFRFPKSPTFIFITDGNTANFHQIESISYFNPIFPEIRGHLYKMLFEETNYYLKIPGIESIQGKFSMGQNLWEFFHV